jgi:biopolymer transport protein ExbB
VNTSALAPWAELIQDGGFVMPPLVGATLALWFCLGWRAMTLRRGALGGPGALLAHYRARPDARADGIVARAARHAARAVRARAPFPADLLDERFGHLEDEMGRFGVVVSSIVAIAPLTGLLGTVSGMIETFESLGDMTLFSSSGGIAGGISQALITTQMGLAIAIPGLIVGRVLDRKQARLAEELDQLKHLAAAAIAQPQEPTP